MATAARFYGIGLQEMLGMRWKLVQACLRYMTQIKAQDDLSAAYVASLQYSEDRKPLERLQRTARGKAPRKAAEAAGTTGKDELMAMAQQFPGAITVTKKKPKESLDGA